MLLMLIIKLKYIISIILLNLMQLADSSVQMLFIKITYLINLFMLNDQHPYKILTISFPKFLFYIFCSALHITNGNQNTKFSI